MHLLILLITVVLGSNTLLWAKRSLNFGVFLYAPESHVQQQYQPLVDYLNVHLKEIEIKLVPLDRSAFDEALQHNKLDIISTNPAHFEVIHNNNLFIRPIATTKKLQNGISTDSFGGVIFTRADNKTLMTLEDLKSSKIASMDIKSLGAYQSQVYEFFKKGIDIKKNLSVMDNHNDIMRSVIEGKHDAGFIRTGVLESEIEQGRLKAEDIKVINSQNMSYYPYYLSTQLYPEWPIAILPHIEDDIANELTIALLGFTPKLDKNSSLYGFTLPQNYASVQHMIKALGLPPYDTYEEVTYKQIYQQYRTEIFVFLSFVVMLVIIVFVIIKLNIKIRTSEERFKLAMEGTQDALFDWNMKDDTMFHSKQFELMLGYDGTELPETIDAWKDLLHPDDMEDAYASVDAYLKAKGKKNYVSVFRMRSKDGSWRLIEGRGKALFDANGVPERFIGFNTDITEKSEHEKQLLVQTKHAQMGEMIAMIAHQWRQPLSAIAATTSSLQVKQLLDKMDAKSLTKGLEEIVNLTQHLSKTIDDFRDFFKEEKQKTDVKLDELVKESIKIMNPVFMDKGIKLYTEYLCDKEISTYKNELKQVLLNILKNAQDVIVEREIEDPMVTVTTYMKDGKYCISIEDNAGGIPETVINKIFEPYYTTKSSLNGTGLGLYMSKIIINEHCKGNIEARNINDGALFIISMNKSVD